MARIINAATSGGLVTSADTSGILQLQTASTTAVTVDASQNVGIGTASPGVKLEVNGATSIFGAAGTAAGLTALTVGDATNATFRMAFTNGPLIQLATNSTVALAFGTKETSAGTFTERVRIPAAGGFQSVGSISVGNATPSASGAGITFPADQSILGASSNANTLDDYEEGTWTPALGGFSSITYSAQTGTYTKIGNVVNVVCNMVVTGGTRTSADLQVFQLPFTSASQNNSGGSWGYGFGVVASTVGLPQLRINSSGTTVSLLNTAGGVLAGTDLNTATPTINFSATYTV
jgi:hypothetical protein